MKVAVLFSGGKDSTFALWWAVQQGWNVRCLVTLRSEKTDSHMFHTPNISLTSLQAECLGLPLISESTSGEKESELEDLRRALLRGKTEYGVDCVITGAVASNYQEERVNRICHELGLRTFSPLWHKDQRQLIKDMIFSGFEFKLGAVAGMGLDESYLGATVDENMVRRLEDLHRQYGIHVAGEGGEFESIVVDCPLFSKRLVIDAAEKRMEGPWNGVWLVTAAHVEQKA